MINVDSFIKEIQKKRKYDKISRDNLPTYIKKLEEDFNLSNENKLKHEIIIALDKIDSTLWEIEDGDEYILNNKLNKYVKDLIEKKDYISLTIPVNVLKELSDYNINSKEYFECKKLFKEKDLPESNIVSLLKQPKDIKNRIINNIDEDTFRNVVRNNYCDLYTDISKKQTMTNVDKKNFVKLLDINNSIIESAPYNDDFEKDSFHIENVEELKNIDNIKDNKINELINEKYSTYDIKREFCNRFMNIDPIILENVFYNPKNKELLDKLEDIDTVKEIVNISRKDKDSMIRIYSMYLNSGKTIKLPDNLLTYGYAYTSTSEVNEIKEGKIDYNIDKYYHEIYFCRECLLDSNQKKRDRETQFEIPIGAIRNNKHFTYENIVRDNVYDRNMAYPKIEIRKEEIDSKWFIRDYLTLEAINSNVDINNPKRFDNEIPMSKNYSHLYDSYMYKQVYDQMEKEKSFEKLESEMNEIFGKVGLTTDIVKEAMLKKPQDEEDPII